MSGDLGAYWKKIERARDFHVRVVVREPRDTAIEHGKDSVHQSHGDILDFKMFGNLALSMIIELTGRQLLVLLDSLLARGWSVEVEPGREAVAQRADDALEGTLQLTFPEGDGELRIPTPWVPG
jgi:hypothetical protein